MTRPFVASAPLSLVLFLFLSRSSKCYLHDAVPGSSHSLFSLFSNLWRQTHLSLKSRPCFWVWIPYINCLWNVSSYWDVSWIPRSQHLSPAELTLFSIPYSQLWRSPTLWQMILKPEPGELSRTPPSLPSPPILPATNSVKSAPLVSFLSVLFLSDPAFKPSGSLTWITEKPSNPYPCPESGYPFSPQQKDLSKCKLEHFSFLLKFL